MVTEKSRSTIIVHCIVQHV